MKENETKLHSSLKRQSLEVLKDLSCLLHVHWFVLLFHGCWINTIRLHLVHLIIVGIQYLCNLLPKMSQWAWPYSKLISLLWKFFLVQAAPPFQPPSACPLFQGYPFLEISSNCFSGLYSLYGASSPAPMFLSTSLKPFIIHILARYIKTVYFQCYWLLLQLIKFPKVGLISVV